MCHEEFRNNNCQRVLAAVARQSVRCLQKRQAWAAIAVKLLRWHQRDSGINEGYLDKPTKS